MIIKETIDRVKFIIQLIIHDPINLVIYDKENIDQTIIVLKWEK